LQTNYSDYAAVVVKVWFTVNIIADKLQ